ncbi:unnamed protein product [Rotaria sordida]|uniref:Uncharacterized protein n=1 Tax=Rotaria sordida TaxID=392033 RepID=A0A816AAQ9_9BILA|nr:unnamed protein product [Rotaria sordida]CAF1595626.1 unnamed protein product [Rotaria sordida]
MISTNKKREETSSKTYTVERLLKQRRIEYLENILDKSLIDSYKKQIRSISPRTSSPKKPIRNQNNDLSSVKNDSIHDCDEQIEKDDDNNKQEKTLNLISIDY